MGELVLLGGFLLVAAVGYGVVDRVERYLDQAPREEDPPDR